jgi:TorA maturation chaperone TorD
MTIELATASPTALDLLRDAAEWHLIGRLFACPREGWFTEVAAIAAEVVDANLRQAAQAAQEEAGEGLYHTTFGPGGPAAPREASYQDAIFSGRSLAEIRGYHAAFGYPATFEEAPDHIAIEAGFVGYLRFKEAFAHVRGALDQAEITADAARRFIETHVSLIAEPLAKVLEGSGISYLTLAATSLQKRSIILHM